MITSSTIHVDEFASKFMHLNPNGHVNGGVDTKQPSIAYNDVTTMSHSNSTSPLVINMSSASSTNDNDDRRDSEIIQRFVIMNDSSKVNRKNTDTNPMGNANSPNSISSHCSNSTAGECTSSISSDQSLKLTGSHRRAYSPPISNGSTSSIKSPHSCDEPTSPMALLKMAKKELIAMSPDSHDPDRESRSSSHDRSSFMNCGKSDASSGKTVQKRSRDNNVIPQRKRRDFIPNELKDDSYWERRRKNNLAAKRSREKRRLNDIVLEAKVIELNKKHNIVKFKLDLVMNKYQMNEDELEVLYDENKHLFVNVQENLGLSELTNDSTQNNMSGDMDTNTKDNDMANSSCSSINDNHSSGEESGFTGSYHPYNRHGPPQKKKIPNEDPIFKPIELHVQDKIVDSSDPSEPSPDLTGVNKEQSKSQYPLLYTQLCKAMNNRNSTSNLGFPQNPSHINNQMPTALNVMQSQKTFQQQHDACNTKNDLAHISLANMRSIMNSVSRERNQQPSQTQFQSQPQMPSRTDVTSQKLISTLINEYFRHDKNEVSMAHRPAFEPERSSNLLNYQIEKYKSLINKTSSNKNQMPVDSQHNFVNNYKQEAQRSRKRNFQSVSKIVAEQQQQKIPPMAKVENNMDAEMQMKNTKFENGVEMYMEKLLAKYAQPKQRLNSNEHHANAIQPQTLINSNINKMSANDKYVDENLEILNENLINLNQTAQAMFLQELKQQQQQQQHQQQHHPSQINMKCISNTSPFSNSINNSNSGVNNGDNMPLKLRFKMLQLKTGEVN
jgi:hypothetical protein